MKYEKNMHDKEFMMNMDEQCLYGAYSQWGELSSDFSGPNCQVGPRDMSKFNLRQSFLENLQWTY